MESARVGIPVRQGPQGSAGRSDHGPGRALTPFRFDPSIPGNAAKFDAVEQLIDVAEGIGCTLPELALAFATTHPAVTSVISGPRTMEQLDGLLKSADLTLDDAT